MYLEIPIRRVLCKRCRKVKRESLEFLSDNPFYTLLSRWENLSLPGRRSLEKRLSANKRLQTTYLLKESFDQLWGYRREGWARRFFDHWKESLKWQRLQPFEKFAAIVERNWSGITAFCEAEEKFSLGFVEGVDTKIRVIQRRAYGLRDEEYLRLKVLTCMLPEIWNGHISPTRLRDEPIEIGRGETSIPRADRVIDTSPCPDPFLADKNQIAGLQNLI